MDHPGPPGRYLGNVLVTEDLSPAESYTTNFIEFEWQEGDHTLWAMADSDFDVYETNECNNWYDEDFDDLVPVSSH